MSRRVLLEPEASTELEAAARWYEAQRAGLGLAFIASVDQAVEHLTSWPEAGTPVTELPAELAVRKVPISRFPYYLAYVVIADTVRVLAVVHERRRPGYWHERA